MDELTLKAWVDENADLLVGASVWQLTRPPYNAVDVDIETRGGRRFQLTLAPGGGGAVFLAHAERRDRRPRFKSWLEEAVVRAVKQHGDDRVLLMDFARDDDDATLVVTLYGATGGAYLASGGLVKEALAGRRLRPGDALELTPRPPRRMPADFGLEAAARLDEAAFVRDVAYASPALARVIYDDGKLIPERWMAFADVASGGRLSPAASKTGDFWKASALAFEGDANRTVQRFPSVNDAVAFAFQETARDRGLAAARASAARRLSARIEKLKRQRAAVGADLGAHERYDEYRRMGEALKVNLGVVPRGATALTLPDPYGGMIAVELAPGLGPRENVVRLFNLYRKGKRGSVLARERIVVIDAEIERTEKELAAVGAAGDLAALAPWLYESGRRPGQAVAAAGPGRRYLSSDGYVILVGRSAADNDALTFGLARPHDIWLHAHQGKGSHVVIRRDEKNKPVPRSTLLEAAALAAFHSNARHASIVPVVIVERRYVRKAKGAPGLALYRGGDVVDVEPAEIIKPAPSRGSFA